MKKILVALLLALTALLLCAGCANQRFDYANWKSYVFPNEHSFSYPQDWEAASTENGLLYVNPLDDEYNKQTIEKNAYSSSFQGVRTIHNEIGPGVGIVYGIDLVSANYERRLLKYIWFEPEPGSYQEFAGGYVYKIYFSEEVSDDVFQQIYGSCE